MDLTSKLNRDMWERALLRCCKGILDRQLSDGEERFVRDMLEEYKMNGSMMEPSVKQFNWLRQIAFDLDK